VYLSTVQEVTPSQPSAATPPKATRHILFAAVLAIAACLRITTMLGYRPGSIYYDGSYSYLDLALHPRPAQGFRNTGYPLLLWLLRPFHSILVVLTVQHVLGLAMGLMAYALLRRRSVPAWGAVLATVPVLFDAQMLQLENAVLSDTWFIFLVVSAVVTLMWRPGRPSARAAGGACLLLALAALTRSVGVPLLLAALGYLAVTRIGLLWFAVAAIAVLLPLALYATWVRAESGTFALSQVDGVSLWARTMTFADCDKIRPPAAEAPLCPNGDARGRGVGVRLGTGLLTQTHARRCHPQQRRRPFLRAARDRGPAAGLCWGGGRRRLTGLPLDAGSPPPEGDAGLRLQEGFLARAGAPLMDPADPHRL
jgi:hypothetical protein